MRPATGDDVTLVLPCVNAEVMDLFLAHFADTVDPDAHAVMMLDGAGWHDARALTVPDNVTLALLPPYSPELNPVERVWLYLRERFLSLRVLDDTEAIIDACCQAWIDLIAEPDRMRTLCAYPWIMKVISLAHWYYFDSNPRIRSGVKGSRHSDHSMSSASITALAIAAGAPMVPLSAMPL